MGNPEKFYLKLNPRKKESWRLELLCRFALPAAYLFQGLVGLFTLGFVTTNSALWVATYVGKLRWKEHLGST